MRDPSGIAVDPRKPGRVLVADTLNHRVDVFAADGKALGSFGARGSGDGMLDHPADVAVDGEGNAFVSDTGNDRIVEFDAQGNFLRHFGGRGSYPGLFAAPSGLDVFQGELFVADRDNHRIEVLGLDGRYRYEWGLHALRPREGAGRFHYPCDVRVTPDGARVRVLEEIEDRVQEFGPVKGEIEVAQGERDTSAHYAGGCSLRGDLLATIEPSGPSVSIWDLTKGTPIEITRFGRFGRGAGFMVRPSSVLLDAQAEVVYVADPYASRISAFRIARPRDEPLKYERDLARLVRSVDLTSDTLPLRDRWTIEPEGLALGEHGEVLVADRANARVVVFSPELVPVRAFGVPIDPVGIAFDAQSGRTYVTDPVARALAVVARDGKLEKVVEAHAAQPFGVAVGAQGKVWVTDRRNGLLLALSGDALGFVTTSDQRTPEHLSRGELMKPEGIACDTRGRVLVVEAGNHRFQLFDGDGRYIDMGGARFYTEAARTPPAPLVAHAWDDAHSVTTNGGTWRVLWRAKPAVIPRAETFSIEAWVFAAGDPEHPVRNAKLTVDAWMPDHMHGMTRVPTVQRREDGGFDVDGLLFHMSGTWEIDFDVVKDAVAERAQTRLDLP
jgi:DNA-binding beta-propeller fold protein YncE